MTNDTDPRQDRPTRTILFGLAVGILALLGGFALGQTTADSDSTSPVDQVREREAQWDETAERARLE
ncbi:MAG: hypothetical protein P8P69_04830, partial [Ilumatobacter sp.]|nr:hypothetical protein [Ilumatobacter sp.]